MKPNSFSQFSPTRGNLRSHRKSLVFPHFLFYYPRQPKQREFGNLGTGQLLCCRLSRQLPRRVFPADFPSPTGFPEIGLSFPSPAQQTGSLATALLRPSVGKWSAKTKPKGQNSLALLGIWREAICAHNPEVGGSSPPSATRSSRRNEFRYDDFFVLFRHLRSYHKNRRSLLKSAVFDFTGYSTNPYFTLIRSSFSSIGSAASMIKITVAAA